MKTTYTLRSLKWQGLSSMPQNVTHFWAPLKVNFEARRTKENSADMCEDVYRDQNYILSDERVNNEIL